MRDTSPGISNTKSRRFQQAFVLLQYPQNQKTTNAVDRRIHKK